MTEWDETSLMAARDRHEQWLMDQPGVTGTAIGCDDAGRLCIKILTDQIGASEREKIRSRLKGLPVCFEETGPITSL